jgi:cell division protein FtsI (penicillin-binding protein 3)
VTGTLTRPPPARHTAQARHPSSGNRIRGPTGRVSTVRRRNAWLIIVTLLGLGVLAGRLVQIQVLDRAAWAELGDSQSVAARDLPASRGAILDRDLGVLALSDGRPTIWADPRLVIDPAATAAALASVLEIDQAVVEARLASGRHFVYISRQVEPAQQEVVAEMQLPGIASSDEMTRLLPNGRDFARGLLGSVDPDQLALSGLEMQFTDLLTGTEGHEIAETSLGGITLPSGIALHESALPGDDVVLTIHTETQFLTEQALIAAVAGSSAKGASAVVMEVESGEILAIAGVVRDPETGEVSVAGYNPAYVDAFEPGSVNKTFTIAAALEEGRIRPDQIFSVPPNYEFADKVFQEQYAAEPRALSTGEILAISSNIGTIQIAEAIGEDRLYQYLIAFGFGSTTGPDGTQAVPAETAGILHETPDWHGTALATISFGQGIAVSGVQLAAAYNTIANDGVYIAPSIHKGTVSSDGAFHPIPGSDRRRVLGAETAAIVRGMLGLVVTEGTGKLAAIDGYLAGGKTGTAQKPYTDRAGYSETAYTSTFAGMVPIDRPALTIVVTIDEAEDYLAGRVAAPVFSEIAEYALRVLRVPPTN